MNEANPKTITRQSKQPTVAFILERLGAKEVDFQWAQLEMSLLEKEIHELQEANKKLQEELDILKKDNGG